MTEPSARLPSRPSADHLRKQAKGLLRRHRAGYAATRERFRRVITTKDDLRRSRGVALADAQFVLGREYGFGSWAKLLRHVRSAVSSARLEQFERLAEDFLSAYGGNAEAAGRVGAHFGLSHATDGLLRWVRDRLDRLRGAAA